jgi:hypothetical protein
LYEGSYYKTEKTFGVYKIKRTKNEQIEHVVKSKLKIKFALTMDGRLYLRTKVFRGTGKRYWS